MNVLYKSFTHGLNIMSPPSLCERTLAPTRHKRTPEECFEDIMVCFETSSWEHLCGCPSPSAARVVSRFKALSLPLYLYGIFYTDTHSIVRVLLSFFKINILTGKW